MQINSESSVDFILRNFPDIASRYGRDRDALTRAGDFDIEESILKYLNASNTESLIKLFSYIEQMLECGDNSVVFDAKFLIESLRFSQFHGFKDVIMELSGKLTRAVFTEATKQQYIFDNVTQKMLDLFPEYLSFKRFDDDDNDDIELAYSVASKFVDFILNAKQSGNQELYTRGLQFIEELHFHEEPKVRELATIGYLEDLYFLSKSSFDDLGEESKKWWNELSNFFSKKNKYVGETYDK